MLLISFFGNDFVTLASCLYYFNQYFQSFFLIIVSLIILVSRDFVNNQKITRFEYDTLLLFVFLSALCLCFADDFLLFYLAIELQSLCFYVFATFARTSEYSTESGLKYFVFGAIISCVLLLGFSFIYITFGTVSFEFLSCLSLTSAGILFSGILFVLIALLFKIGAAPFHLWLCDVYDGSLTSVTLLFAGAPKIIIFSIIIKLFVLTFFEFSDAWLPFVFFAGVLSIIVGSVSAIYQKRLKRLFAYSTVAHSGFLLFGLVCMSVDSIGSLIFYIFIYSGLTVLLFSLLIFSVVTQVNFPAFIANWTSSGLRNYVAVISFALVLFSVAGIPPLAGFFSKLVILLSLVGQGYYVTSVVIVIISSVACFYYIRLIKAFFFVKSSKNNLWVSTKKRQNSEFCVGLLLFFNLTFCFFPEFLALISTTLSLVLS